MKMKRLQKKYSDGSEEMEKENRDMEETREERRGGSSRGGKSLEYRVVIMVLANLLAIVVLFGAVMTLKLVMDHKRAGERKPLDGTVVGSIIDSWYQNEAMVSIRLASDTNAVLIVNSNNEGYMEYADSIRVYTQNNKACILNDPVEVVGELSPIEVVRSIFEYGGIEEKDISYVDASMIFDRAGVEEGDDAETGIGKCYISRVYGYEGVYKALASRAGNDYAIQVLNSFGVQEEDDVEIFAAVYRGVRSVNSDEAGESKAELLFSDINGYNSAQVEIEINGTRYLVYSLVTRVLLLQDFVLDPDWYRNNSNDRWVELARDVHGQISDIVNGVDIKEKQ